MSINTDGPKRQGKFLKKGSKIMKAVHLTDFNFSQIRAENTIEFDNAERSIIHAKFHDPEEIARGVREHRGMNEKLIDATHPQLSVIMPADFTEDWHNERLNTKRRAMGFDDDDDYDYPSVVPSKKTAATTEVTKPVEPISAQPTDLKVMATPDEVAPLDAEQIASKARVVSIVEEPYAPKNTQTTAAESSQPRSEEFIPLDSREPHTAEDQAIATYKQRAELEKQSAAVLEELKTAAKAEGYQDGFRLGEEKGVVAGQAAAGEIFHRVSELLVEFEGLKRNVLENIQKNFYELSQALGESLLEREFSIRPEAFTKVLDKVIVDTVSDNEFKIRLHPETWQKVVDLKVPNLESHLIKDPAITKGEFKIESNLTIVDGNTKKIVAQMLQNVDMTLFEETKIAG